MNPREVSVGEASKMASPQFQTDKRKWEAGQLKRKPVWGQYVKKAMGNPAHFGFVDTTVRGEKTEAKSGRIPSAALGATPASKLYRQRKRALRMKHRTPIVGEYGRFFSKYADEIERMQKIVAEEVAQDVALQVFEGKGAKKRSGKIDTKEMDYDLPTGGWLLGTRRWDPKPRKTKTESKSDNDRMLSLLNEATKAGVTYDTKEPIKAGKYFKMVTALRQHVGTGTWKGLAKKYGFGAPGAKGTYRVWMPSREVMHSMLKKESAFSGFKALKFNPDLGNPGYMKEMQAGITGQLLGGGAAVLYGIAAMAIEKPLQRMAGDYIVKQDWTDTNKLRLYYLAKAAIQGLPGIPLGIAARYAFEAGFDKRAGEVASISIFGISGLLMLKNLWGLVRPSEKTFQDLYAKDQIARNLSDYVTTKENFPEMGGYVTTKSDLPRMNYYKPGVSDYVARNFPRMNDYVEVDPDEGMGRYSNPIAKLRACQGN